MTTFATENIRYIDVEPHSDEHTPAWTIEDAEGNHFIAQILDGVVDLFTVDPNTGNIGFYEITDAERPEITEYFQKLHEEDF